MTRNSLFAIALLAAMACDFGSSGGSKHSFKTYARFFHADPLTPGVNAVVLPDNQALATGLEFGDPPVAGDTKQISPDATFVSVRDHVSGTVLTNEDAVSIEDTATDYFLWRNNGAADIFSSVRHPDTEKVNGWLVNLLPNVGPDFGAVDIYVGPGAMGIGGATKIADDLLSSASTSLGSVTQPIPSPFRIFVTEKNTTNVLVDSGPLTEIDRYVYVPSATGGLDGKIVRLSDNDLPAKR